MLTRCGLGVSSKRTKERPVVHAVRAAWTDSTERPKGIAGINHIAFDCVLEYSGDRQQDFVTQTHEVATRVVTMLATAGPDAHGAAFVRVMDYTRTTKRDLLERRSLVAGAIVGAVRPVIQATFLASGQALAVRVGGKRDGESKDDLTAALGGSVPAGFRDAALAAWAALIECTED